MTFTEYIYTKQKEKQKCESMFRASCALYDVVRSYIQSFVLPVYSGITDFHEV